MTKGELRKARQAAREAGQPLTGELALPNQPSVQPKPQRKPRPRYNSMERFARWHYDNGDHDYSMNG